MPLPLSDYGDGDVDGCAAAKQQVDVTQRHTTSE